MGRNGGMAETAAHSGPTRGGRLLTDHRPGVQNGHRQERCNRLTSMNNRNGTIDIVRYFAALGVVLFHVKSPLGWIGNTSLLLFVMLLAFFAFPREFHPGGLRHRLAGLLRLWAAWSAVYAGLKVAQAISTGTPISEEFEPWMLLTGPALHLWFLPFAVAVTLIAHAIAAALNSRRICTARPALRNLTAAAVLLVLLASIAAVALSARTAGDAIPFAQWVNAWPSAALGLGLAITRNRLPPAAAAFILFSMFFSAGILLPSGGMSRAIGNAAPVLLLFALANAVRTPGSAVTSYLRDVSLNVYLLHPAVIAVLLQLRMVEYATASMFWLTSIISTIIALVILVLQQGRKRRSETL